MAPTKEIKEALERAKKAVRSKCSDLEWRELKHIVSMEISGCAVGLCMLGIHVLAERFLHKDVGMSFFAHEGVVDNEFIFSGIATTGLLCMLSGWFLEKQMYRYVVAPWMGLIAHSVSLIAGLSVPVAIGNCIEGKSVAGSIGLFLILFIVGNFIAALVTLLSIGANPEQPAQSIGAVDGVFRNKVLRFVMGFGFIWISFHF